ncbi:MAG: thiamine pyrophosphate-binding protein [Sphingobium limneticum]
MNQITGGALLVRALQAAGVEQIFGLHGAHIDPVFQACLDTGLPIYDTRNEASAGHAAEGFARTARKLGVALVTAGGGLTNVLTPIANAWLDRTPILVITGSGMLRDEETNTLQAGIDQVALAQPITKWAKRITSAAHIERLTAQAIRIALSPPYGPVLLDLPWDILMEATEDSGQLPYGAITSAFSAADTGVVSDILGRVARAERPVLLVGSEASRGDAADAIARFASATGTPVFADYEGLNQLAEVEADLCGGLLQGLNGFDKAGLAPDLVLLFGMRFGLNTAHGSPTLLPADASIVQVDPDARELGRLRPVDLGIQADVATTLRALADAAEHAGKTARSDWPTQVRGQIDRRLNFIRNGSTSTNALLHPFAASEIVARHVGENSLVLDGALTYLWFSEVASSIRPKRLLCHGYLGSMGIGMGTALGSQVASLEAGRRTILITGDGAVGYALGEFDAMVRHRLPVIVIVMNNQSWGATQHFQKLAVGPNRITNTMLENGRYDRVAEALGARGYYAEDAKGLEQALSDALSRDEPACINVRVDLDPIPPEELILIGIDPFADPAGNS